MKIEPHSDLITDYLIYSKEIKLGVKETDMITGELYVWAELSGPLKLSTYRELRKLRALARGRRVICNVSAEKPRALAFARFFGFQLIETKYGIDIMELN